MRPRRFAATLLALGCISCAANAPDDQVAGGPEAVRFTEIALAVGLDFAYFSGRAGRFYPCEIMGSGLAWLDYDNDGDLDLFVVQGAMIDPGSTPAEANPPWSDDRPPLDRLFRNDLRVAPDGTRELRFVDVTSASGIVSDGYGMGVAAGDYDNDGWVDLYVTQVGPNRLLRNNGDGTFSDATAPSGVGDPSWSVSAAFVDYDADGRLDLYVTNYLDWAPEKDKRCTSLNGIRDYCAPTSYPPVPDRLYRNRGDGSFEDVTATSGIGVPASAGLGVIATDFDGDGRLDFYVANDRHPNQLWRNRGDGTFEDHGLIAGCALNAEGRAEASMGIDAADFDEDGDEDLFMTHLDAETNTLFVNDGSGGFSDRSARTGVGQPSFEFTGFGGGWLDYDNDGRLDIYAVNGAVRAIEALVLGGDPFPYHQRNQLFRHLGQGRYEIVPSGLGDESAVSRGSAIGDVDNDGDIDIVVSNSDGGVRLFRNDQRVGHRWIGLDMRASAGSRPVLATRVALTTGSGRTLWRRVRRDGSYASSNDPRLLYGLGAEEKVDRIVAHWPDGSVEWWAEPEVDRWHTLLKGSGQKVTD